MSTTVSLKVPGKGETVLVLNLSDTDEKFEAYREQVLANGGRLRRADGWRSFQKHLAVYTPTFIVVIKDEL
jgi:hypothetical protein